MEGGDNFETILHNQMSSKDHAQFIHASCIF